jgi:hypothetical protein
MLKKKTALHKRLSPNFSFWKTSLCLSSNLGFHKARTFWAVFAALCLGTALILSLAGCDNGTGGSKEPPDTLNLGGTITFSGIRADDTPPALKVYSDSARTALITGVPLAIGEDSASYTWMISIDNSYAGADLYFRIETAEAEPRTIDFVYTADSDDNESGVHLSIIKVSFTATETGSNITIPDSAKMPGPLYGLPGDIISLPLSSWKDNLGFSHPVFTRTNSTFIGWKNEAAEGAFVYGEGELYTITETADFSMNAQWLDFVLADADVAYGSDPKGKKIVKATPNAIPQGFTIPSKGEGVDITEIAAGAFYAQDIVKLTIPETVQYIGGQAFDGIPGLAEVTMGPFPYSNSAVEANAFSGGLGTSAVLDKTKRLTYKKVDGVWYGRGGSFYMFAFKEPGDIEEIDLPQDDAYFPRTESQTLTIVIDTENGEYDSYEWWINGTKKTGQGWTGAEVTFTATDFDGIIGECPITAIAGKDGVYYSAKFELVIGE